jgi:four helix bundle protein
MAVKPYQDFVAWQKAIALVKEIYRATDQLPQNEIYGLTSQLRRAAVSIPSKIAEGQGRASSGEFIQFLCHARCSLFEVETQVIVATDIGYLSNDQRTILIDKVSELGRILNGLINSVQNRKRTGTSHQPPATGH